MTTFYLVRHGKTELNLASCFQGGMIDSPLLPVGIEQATQAGKYLADVHFDFVAVSTQKRAMDTANYIIKENSHLDGLTVSYYDGLRELKFGEREGTEIDVTDEQTNYLRTQPHLYDPSLFFGETLDQLAERNDTVIKQLCKKYPNGTILLVAHGVVLITLINRLTGKNKSQWREGGPLENTSISIVEQHSIEKTFTIKRFNDISYRTH